MVFQYFYCLLYLLKFGVGLMLGLIVVRLDSGDPLSGRLVGILV